MDWVESAREAAERYPGGQAELVRRLGIPAATLSTLLSDHPPKTSSWVDPLSRELEISRPAASDIHPRTLEVLDDLQALDDGDFEALRHMIARLRRE